ncbi:hypothetical protein ACWGI8_38485 [Streptomyces sp. NPDC054841]
MNLLRTIAVTVGFIAAGIYGVSAGEAAVAGDPIWDAVSMDAAQADPIWDSIPDILSEDPIWDSRPTGAPFDPIWD